MIRDKNNAMLAGFYKAVAAYMLKRGMLTLAEIKERNPKRREEAFSWMQWPDAKQWFMTVGGEPRAYKLKSHLQQMTLTELLTMINDYYDESTRKAR